ncbi:DUF5076 domain-containing protein [Amylibacter sp. IMCC11727]|uniref:DUF5076 domain-containing protein n=1 Tax=Amylibacter sp. IMCC11727 TaxID=3039851 RepID=UPI00244E4FEA|nr:DUF5076 domain-containing protein [Amylibacter sp. IMCC11727]WGI20569.1 DUF5076 domain-containing protein [Amylibacter sp. IMCC11727]
MMRMILPIAVFSCLGSAVIAGDCANKPFFTAEGNYVANEPLVVNIRTECLGDPKLAGLVLADFAQHLALAHARTGKAKDRQTALDEMLQLFVAELQNPTTQWPER